MKITLAHGTYDNCSLHFHKYRNGSQSLTIQDDYGHPLINVTKCVPDYIPNYNQILVKNYSENKGILNCLVKHKIIVDTGIMVLTGFTHLHICELLVDPKTYNEA